MSLHDLTLGPSLHAGSPALVTVDTTWSRARLDAEVSNQVAALAAVTRAGDRVAVVAGSRPEVVALLIAVPTAGRIAVPINIRLRPEEIATQLDAVGASTVVATPSELDRIEPCLDRIGSLENTMVLDDRSGELRSVRSRRPTESSGEGPLSPGGHDDPSWIIFTSGTTGRAKGVTLTATGLSAAVATSVVARPLADDDVYLYPFPLYHVSAYNVLHALHRGRPVVLPSRFDVDEIAGLAARHGVTTMSLAPTMLRMLLDSGESFPSLRTVSYGAAPMPPLLLAEASDSLRVGFAQGYGMTELSGNAVFLSAADHRRGLDGDERLLRAAGRPGPGVELRITDDDARSLAPGRPGELRVRSAQVCPGYWNEPRATAEAIVDRWLRTGDIGIIDEDGVLTIVDRAKDIIVTGGENVASREVEDVIGRHPSVARVSVVGVPDERWGEAICAAVVLRSGTDVDEVKLEHDLIAHAAGSLARFKVPKRVAIVHDLPVNAAGKVVKNEVRQTFTAKDQGEQGAAPGGTMGR